MKKAVISLSVVAVMLLVSFIAFPVNTFGSVVKETVINTPDEISYIADVKNMPSGELVLIGGNQKDKTLIKYVSNDEGDTWKKECEYLEKLPIDMADAAAVEGFGYISDDGYMGITVSTYKKDIQHITAENEDELGTELYAYIIDPDGNITEVTQPTTKEYGGFYKAYFAGDRLFFDDIRGNLYEVNRESGELIGQVMVNTDFLFASVVTYNDELHAVTNEELGHPIDSPYPEEVMERAASESPEDILVYHSAAEAVDGTAFKCYVVDMNGISVYYKNGEKELLYKNYNRNVNEYTHFYDMTSIDDNTFIVDAFDEKTGIEELIKYEVQR